MSARYFRRADAQPDAYICRFPKLDLDPAERAHPYLLHQQVSADKAQALWSVTKSIYALGSPLPYHAKAQSLHSRHAAFSSG